MRNYKLGNFLGHWSLGHEVFQLVLCSLHVHRLLGFICSILANQRLMNPLVFYSLIH